MWPSEIPVEDIISFSGGYGSAASAIIAYEKGIPFKMIFANTKGEDKDLFRFMRDVERAVNQEVIKLEDGRNIWEVFIDKRFIGNSRTAHCSDILKTQVIKKWMDENTNPKSRLILGMNAGEIDRIDRAQIKWENRKVASLLIEHKVSNSQIKEMFEVRNIRTPNLYLKGFPHNNCGGKCVRAGLKQWLTVLLTDPEGFEYESDALDYAMNEIGSTAKPFLRATIDGQFQYITLKQFKQYYEQGKITIDPYDYGGCGCFVD